MRDFDRKVIAALRRKGIKVIGTVAIPAFEGDTTFSGRAYRLDDNGTHKIRSHSEVLELASS